MRLARRILQQISKNQGKRTLIEVGKRAAQGGAGVVIAKTGYALVLAKLRQYTVTSVLAGNDFFKNKHV